MKTLPYIIGAVVIVLIVSGVFIFQAFSGTIDTSISPGSFISVPTYGFIRCDQASSGVRSDYTMFSDVPLINCQSAGDTLAQYCTITFKMPSSSEIGSTLSVKNSALLYTVCTQGQTCALNEGDAATQVIYARSLFIDSSHVNEEINVPLVPGQFIKAQYMQSGIVSSPALVSKGRWSISLTPYNLVKYDVFSQQNGATLPNSRDCAYDGAINELNYVIEAVKGNGALSKTLPTSNAITPQAIRARGARTVYISNFVAIDPQYSLFNNSQNYCYDKKIYAVETVVTPGGSYKVANTNSNAIVSTVDCCNQADVPTGYTCVNFKKVAISSGQTGCSALNPCPVIGYQPIPGRQVVYQTCDSGVCNNHQKTVACNYDEECANGYCDKNSADPTKNVCKQISPQQYCGNGVCEARYGETAQSCPKDCAASGTNYTLWFIIIGVLLVIVIVLSVYLAVKKK